MRRRHGGVQADRFFEHRLRFVKTRLHAKRVAPARQHAKPRRAEFQRAAIFGIGFDVTAKRVQHVRQVQMGGGEMRIQRNGTSSRGLRLFMPAQLTQRSRVMSVRLGQHRCELDRLAKPRFGPGKISDGLQYDAEVYVKR